MKQLLFIIFLISCVWSVSSQSRVYRDILQNYNPGHNQIHPGVSVIHTPNKKSTLYISYYLNEFNTLKDSSVSLSYSISVYSFENYVKTFDRVNNAYSYKIVDNISSFTDTVFFSVPEDIHCLIDISIKNGLSEEIYRSFLPTIKSKNPGKDNFIVSSHGSISHFNYIPVKEYSIQSTFKFDSIQFEYFSNTFSPAKAPYAIEEVDSLNTLQADSIITIYKTENLFLFNPQKKGVYSLILNEEVESPFSLLVTDSLYPTINSPSSMLEPLYYINKELDISSLKKSTFGSKIELDKFWYFTCNKNKKKAKELIRVFYNRVALANSYFSTYKEGWKTDRGMIFILLGLPSRVNYYTDKEEWLYFNRTDYKEKIAFVFEKQTHSIFNNHYILQRNESYRKIWNLACKQWQSGYIFDYYNYNLKEDE